MLRLLADKGYPAIRIDDVAVAAGVAKTTIYRRWPSLGALALDAVEEALGPRELPDTGDVRADLGALVRLVHTSMVANPIGWALAAAGLDLMRDPALVVDYRRRFIDPLRTRGIVLLRRGRAQGLFDPDLDPEVVVDAFSGAFVLRRLLGEPPPSAAGLTALADAVLRGA
jgi:AcrR family transcriptional regulator